VVNETTTKQPRRGRPRDPAVDRAILESARSVLASKGFTGTSMEEIARTAGVGKDTLYRRWKSKEELVQHLLSVLAAESVPVPAEDDPRYALFVFLQDIVHLNQQSDFGGIVAGIVGESARNPELAAAFRQFWSERRSVAAQIVTRIVDPVTSDQEIEWILDQILAPIYYRLLLTGGPLDDESLWDLIVAVSWPKAEPKNQTRTK
jgi:AcrR family transcriptional regulator